MAPFKSLQFLRRRIAPAARKPKSITVATAWRFWRKKLLRRPNPQRIIPKPVTEHQLVWQLTQPHITSPSPDFEPQASAGSPSSTASSFGNLVRQGSSDPFGYECSSDGGSSDTMSSNTMASDTMSSDIDDTFQFLHPTPLELEAPLALWKPFEEGNTTGSSSPPFPRPSLGGRMFGEEHILYLRTPAVVQVVCLYDQLESPTVWVHGKIIQGQQGNRLKASASHPGLWRVKNHI
ncbi:hypothetical protein R3P38DRAFT_2768512 [Favolaschia claudopus]|uniref:Uncharacterized protein n=1 Tax=Favolaschia claudopus TaxID=2862362 RepID=A0AAW0CPX9_9AGAR